jgi:hypothetical protein
MSTTSPPRLLAQQPFVRFWLARLAGVTANQMLMVAVAWHIYDHAAPGTGGGLEQSGSQSHGRGGGETELDHATA